jgi:hypothetical protein
MADFGYQSNELLKFEDEWERHEEKLTKLIEGNNRVKTRSSFLYSTKILFVTERCKTFTQALRKDICSDKCNASMQKFT